MSLETLFSLDFWMGVALILGVVISIYFLLYWRQR